MTEYKIPSMAEIESTPWNGYNVVSTFSGGGGSCLGYRMAGYKVLLANEFIPEAQMTYKANHPLSILETRDIRDVKSEEILDKIGLKKGELDLFDGSPPCSAFSTAGIGSKGWGKEKEYSGKKQVVDNLFFEYVRVLKGLMPKVFVAENVDALTHGSRRGYFNEIMGMLKDAGYTVKGAVLNSKWLGVPQARKRLIFIGTRCDTGIEPSFPTPQKYTFNFSDAVVEVNNNYSPSPPPLNTKIQKEMWKSTVPGGIYHVRNSTRKVHPDRCCATVTATIGTMHCFKERWLTIPEVKRVQSFPDDFVLTGSFAKQWERLGRSVPPIMMMNISKHIEREILCKMK